MSESEEALPAPTWAEYDDDRCAQALTTEAGAVFERQRQQDVAQAKRIEQDLVERIQYFSSKLRRMQHALAEARISLREKENDTGRPAYGNTEAVSDVAFIRRLPGVLGMRVDEHDRVVVHVRTGMLYRPRWINRERWYDFGDYEIALGKPESNYLLDITCTRYGGIQYRDECYKCYNDNSLDPNHVRVLYWSAPALGIGLGSFCFGTRTDQIHGLRQAMRYAEMLHLVIATMCSVNEGDQPKLPGTFRSFVPSREQCETLRGNLQVLLADPATEPIDP